MSLEKKIKRLFAKSSITVNSKIDERIINDTLTECNQSEESQTVYTKPNSWRIIMKNPITKLAAAAVIIIAAVFSISLLDNSVTTAYALEQSIEANHTIKTIHLRIFEDAESIEKNEFTECWMKYDDAGLLSNLRWNSYDDDGITYSVWNEGVATGWTPAKNVLIVIRNNNAATMMENFAKNYDPKLILEHLYDLQKNNTIELKIDEPAQDGSQIYVKALDSADKTRLELVVDSETKLVTQLSRYSLGEQEDKLNLRIEFLTYNHPIDQSMFELNGIPDDAVVYDQVDQLVGLEKGGLTDSEIAAKVVRECLEATIAKDYDEVSRLMEGEPGNTIEEFIEGKFKAKLSRIISVGQPKPHETYEHILYVPLKIEVENEEKGNWLVNIMTQVQAIDYQPGSRWIMRDNIEVNE